VALPADMRIHAVRWSPEGRFLAFDRVTDEGHTLWVLNLGTGEAEELYDAPMNDALGAGFRWQPSVDGGDPVLVVSRVPPGLGQPPAEPVRPAGPWVDETEARSATNRTYPELLEDEYDDACFEYYMRSSLVRVDLSGEVTGLTEPALVHAVQPSPDGRYLLVRSLEPPFSRTVPCYRFAHRVDVFDRAGTRVHTVTEQPAAEEVPIQGVPTGPRRVSWQPLAPATLVWVEALDEGDPRNEVAHRDRICTHAAPFGDTPNERIRVSERLMRMHWLAEYGRLLTTDYDRDRKWLTTRIHNLEENLEPGAEVPVVFDRSSLDRYGDPGQPVMRRTAGGQRVVELVDGGMYLVGAGASPEGDRPFLDWMDLDMLRRSDSIMRAWMRGPALLHSSNQSSKPTRQST